MTTYSRPPGANQTDFVDARQFEEEVGTWLGDFKIANLDSSTRMDYWIPGVQLDVKEQKSPLGDRFTKHWPGVEQLDLFVIDELSVRRALHDHGTSAYFLIRQRPTGRLFLARADEMACTERVRLDRETSPGNKKGKWLVRLSAFRQITDHRSLLDVVLGDQIALPWKRSECLSELEIPTV